MTPLLAPLLLAATLNIGPPMPIAELRPGDSAAWDRVLTTWTDVDGLHAAVARTTTQHFQAVGMRIRDDGSADPAALVSYPIAGQSAMGTIGNDLMAVWYVWGSDSTTAQRLGRDGTPRSAAVSIPGGAQSVVCSDSTCLVESSYDQAFIDGNGNFIGRPRPPIDDAVASPAGFLTYDRGAKAVAVRDRQGTPGTIIPVAGTLANLSWDGTRYIVLSIGDNDWKVRLLATEIDPRSGATTTRTINLPPYSSWIELSWNGTQYLLLFDTPSGHVVARLDASLQPIDAAPIPVPVMDQHYRPVIAAMQDGFRILYEPTDYLRTVFVRNDGTVIPGAQPVITDRASQQPLAAASSSSAILGVWSEGAGAFAARIGRDGRPLDAAPIAVGQPSTPVRAASDGDGFLLAWDKNALLIDGHGVTTRFDLPVDDPLRYARLEFVNGAYRLAFFGDAFYGRCAAGALTITTKGAVTQSDSFARDCGAYVSDASLAFDGRHLVALWAYDHQVRSGTKDLVTGVVTSQSLVESLGAATPTTAIARDGDSLIVFYDLLGVAVSEVHVNRLTTDGQLLLPPSVVTSRSYAESIIRIGDTWFLAAPGPKITPFDATTFAGGELMTLSDDWFSSLVPGWNGEALEMSLRDVPITSGWATQMIVRTVGPNRYHGRAAGK